MGCDRFVRQGECWGGGGRVGRSSSGERTTFGVEGRVDRSRIEGGEDGWIDGLMGGSGAGGCKVSIVPVLYHTGLVRCGYHSARILAED